MMLGVVIIALLVLLVIVDGSEASGANRGAPHAEALQGDEQEEPATGGSCILKVTSILGRNRQAQRRQSRTPARQGQVQSGQR
jgi:hypothetical protein